MLNNIIAISPNTQLVEFSIPFSQIPIIETIEPKTVNTKLIIDSLNNKYSHYYNIYSNMVLHLHYFQSVEYIKKYSGLSQSINHTLFLSSLQQIFIYDFNTP